MTEIKVKSIPEELITQLDLVYRKKGYDSRSALIVDVLTKYCALGSAFYKDELPDIMKQILQDEIKGSLDIIEEMLSMIHWLTKENMELLKRLKEI